MPWMLPDGVISRVFEVGMRVQPQHPQLCRWRGNARPPRRSRRCPGNGRRAGSACARRQFARARLEHRGGSTPPLRRGGGSRRPAGRVCGSCTSPRGRARRRRVRRSPRPPATRSARPIDAAPRRRRCRWATPNTDMGGQLRLIGTRIAVWMSRDGVATCLKAGKRRAARYSHAMAWMPAGAPTAAKPRRQ